MQVKKKSHKKPAEELELNDVGNAQRLANEHGDVLRYCWPWEKWLCWDGARWKIDDTGMPKELAQTMVLRHKSTANEQIKYLKNDDSDLAAIKREQLKLVRDQAEKSLSAAKINAMMDLVRGKPGIPVHHDQFDKQHFLLNCLSGTIDLTTGQLRPHSQADYLTGLAPVKFDKDAKCPRFFQFLREIFLDNDGLICYMQRLLGHCLTGSTKEQILPIFHGGGANGKGVLYGVMYKLLGPDYACAAPPNFTVQSKGERHPTEIARFYGKRFVVASEIGKNQWLDEAKIKLFTGDDPLSGRRNKEDFWDFFPTHKLIIATNDKPAIKGTDDGIWRRPKLIPFDAQFKDDKADKDLKEKLYAELPGILNWLLQGCLDWQRDGLQEPNVVKVATEEYRSSEDSLGAFLAERCEQDVNATVKLLDLFAAWKWWCEQTGARVGSSKNLSAAMQAKGFKKGKSSVTVLEGIKLVRAAEAMQEAADEHGF